MQYNELDVDQKALLDEYTKQLRAYAGMANRLMQSGQAIKAMADAGAQSILDLLTAGAMVPNTSGLAGAQPLSKEDLTAIGTDNATALAAFSTDTKRQLQTKAAGINAH